MQLVEFARFTDDVDACVEFYERILGSPPEHRFDGGAVFHVGDVELLVHTTYEHDGEGPPPEDHTAFAVEDLDGACKRLQDIGFDLEIPPADYEWGRSAYLRDPDGRLIELTPS